jgi:hypothetical protein
VPYHDIPFRFINKIALLKKHAKKAAGSIFPQQPNGPAIAGTDMRPVLLTWPPCAKFSSDFPI